MWEVEGEGRLRLLFQALKQSKGPSPAVIPGCRSPSAVLFSVGFKVASMKERQGPVRMESKQTLRIWSREELDCDS